MTSEKNWLFLGLAMLGGWVLREQLTRPELEECREDEQRWIRRALDTAGELEETTGEEVEWED
jgi:hypothetical protein